MFIRIGTDVVYLEKKEVLLEPSDFKTPLISIPI
jgi:hypothetical protein